MNWFSDQKTVAVKKMMYEFLQGRYGRNEQAIERAAVALHTQADIDAFVRLMADVYEAGYLRSVEDHREQLGKLGLQVKIVPQATPSKEG